MFLVVLILNNDLSASVTFHYRIFLASSLSYFLLIRMVHHVEIRLCSKPTQRVYYEVGIDGDEDCDDDGYHDICDNKTVMNFAKEGKSQVLS